MATFSPSTAFGFFFKNHTINSNVKYDLSFVKYKDPIPSAVVASSKGEVSAGKMNGFEFSTIPGYTLEEGAFPCLNIDGTSVYFRFWSGGSNQYINILNKNGFNITEDKESFNSASNGRYRVTVDAGGHDAYINHIFFQIYNS